MTTKACICDICGAIHKGEGADESAQRCENQGVPSYRWAVGQRFVTTAGNTLMIVRKRIRKENHLPEYTLETPKHNPRLGTRLRPFGESTLEKYIRKYGWQEIGDIF